MKLKSLQILPVLAATLVLMSCASAPKPEAPVASVNAPAIPDSLTKAKKAADDSRAKALEIKAEVAAKALFEQAEAGYTAGTSLADKTEYDKATVSYTESDALFKKALEEATVKRNAALKSLNKAETDRKASEAAILEAEQAEKGEAL